jgi:hypothetical protein
MKKLLWVNGRKSTGLERQHGVCTPGEINECSTLQTDTKDKTNQVCFNLHEVCPLSLVVCVVCYALRLHSSLDVNLTVRVG